MNFATLQSRVLNRLNMGSDDPAAAVAPDLVNEGIQTVSTQGPYGWPWLHRTVDFSTIANTASYAFTTIDSTYSIARINELRILNGSVYLPLPLLAPDETDYWYATTATNLPTVWYAEGKTVYLRPVPDAVYTIRCRETVVEPELSEDADEPLMPEQYHTAIILAALQSYYVTLQDTVRANATQTQVDKWVMQMRRSSSEYAGPTRVRVRDPLWT